MQRFRNSVSTSSAIQRANAPMSPTSPIKFTGALVCFNEEQRLRDCLASLSFCDQIVMVDLGSSDSSVAIARECGAEVVPHAWVPNAEQVFEFAFAQARNDWIILFAPDEVLPHALVPDIVREIESNPELALINLPYLYYFMGKPLTTTKWGGIRPFGRVLNKQRVQANPQVHGKLEPRHGCKVVTVRATGDNVVQHYWIDTMPQLFEKHNRYIKLEGQRRYVAGKRFSWLRFSYETTRSVWDNLILHRGMLGGATGIFLSFFYAWYLGMAHLSLLRYQRSISKSTSR